MHEMMDSYPSSSSGPMPSLYEVSHAIDSENSKCKVMEILDNLENSVEKLRKDASRLEEERDVVLATLDTVKLLPAINDLEGLDKEEAHRYLERIIARCHTVVVNVFTHRDQSQEDALYQVNQLIDNLVLLLKMDHDAARSRCLSYMNSCSSQTNGLTDKPFESALLGCTIDDQKRVKKRLQGLLKYLDDLGIVTEFSLIMVEHLAGTMDNIMTSLDGINQRVRELQIAARRLEQEKHAVLADMNSLRQQAQSTGGTLTEADKEDIESYLTQIQDLCKNVIINVLTTRDRSQELALGQTQEYMNDLCDLLQTDSRKAKTVCQTYLNSTTSETCGEVDKKFESALLGCTVDDQKDVKQFLQDCAKALRD